MPENQSGKERLREITASIETGIKDLFQSDKYAAYLRTMSKFHNYSVNNVMLIHMQKPDATRVAGFNKWKDAFGRSVKKGEKGIKIIAPTPIKKKIEKEKIDPDTKLPLLDENGNAVTEETEIKIPMFKVVSVFDVSQTVGRPLPQLASDLAGNVENYDVFIEAVRRSSPVPVSIEPMTNSMDGFFSESDQRIALREEMSEVQTVSAAIHEIAHAILHNQKEQGEKYQTVEVFGLPALYVEERIDRDRLPDGLYCYDLRGSDDDPGIPAALEENVTVNRAASVITAEPVELPEEDFLPLGDTLNFTGEEKGVRDFYRDELPEKANLSRRTEEVQAESVSFAVCQYYGIETGENSFGYIASWSKDKELPELKASLETINRTSDRLITDIDSNFREICKERGIGTEKEESVAETVDEETAENAAVSPEEAAVSENTDPEAAIEPPVEETPSQTAADVGAVPDPSMSIEAMNAFGYTGADMLPLSKERALELLERDVTVYMLYDNNAEAMAFEPEDIRLYSGMFGVTREDWELVRDEIPPMKEAAPSIPTVDFERKFEKSPDDAFAIYQVKAGDEYGEYRFEGSEYLDKHGIVPEKSSYECVYAGELPEGNPTQQLDTLYRTFNTAHPEDFRGHSLSVSDIIAMKHEGVVSYHYVDSVGYKELPSFGGQENALKNAEMQLEDDPNMIDGIINNGQKQTDAVEVKKPERHEVRKPEKSERPSALAKLRKYQAEDRQTAARPKAAEKELI